MFECFVQSDSKNGFVDCKFTKRDACFWICYKNMYSYAVKGALCDKICFLNAQTNKHSPFSWMTKPWRTTKFHTAFWGPYVFWGPWKWLYYYLINILDIQILSLNLNSTKPHSAPLELSQTHLLYLLPAQYPFEQHVNSVRDSSRWLNYLFFFFLSGAKATLMSYASKQKIPWR